MDLKQRKKSKEVVHDSVVSNLKKKDAVWPLFVFWAIIGVIGYKLSFDELDYAIATTAGALICGAIWKNL